MKTAILCPGPSLDRFDPAAGYGLVVAVNRAPVIAWTRWRARADWWCCDYRRFLDQTLPYIPGVVIRDKAVQRIAKAGRIDDLKRHPRLAHAELAERWPLAVDWQRFTATVALVVAVDRGATQIDCYGVDWTNQPDADGVACHTNKRSDDRWQEEVPIWNNLVKSFRDQRGVNVRRVVDGQ